MSVLDQLPDLLRLSIVGLVSGLFSAALATRTFVTRRWWERQAEAYSSVVDALSSIVHYYDEQLASLGYPEGYEDPREPELRERERAARETVRRAAAVGSFLISKKSAEAIAWYLTVLGKDQANNWIEHASIEQAAAQQCLDAIVAEAKRDLRRESWLRSISRRITSP